MSPTSDHRVDEYLDGMLAESEQEAFEAALRKDAALRAVVDQQRAIDASLRRTHAPPSFERLEAVLTAAIHVPTDVGLSIRWRIHARRAAVAAVLLLGAFGGWRIWEFAHPSPVVNQYASQPWRSFGTVYKETVAAGFKPLWHCRDDGEFRKTFAGRLGQPLLMASLPPGVKMAGLAYSNTISPRTIDVLVRVDDAPVMVFVDRREREVGPTASPPEGLRLFRHEVDDLVLYELTPLEVPRVLRYFYKPS